MIDLFQYTPLLQKSKDALFLPSPAPGSEWKKLQDVAISGVLRVNFAASCWQIRSKLL
ncbi:MAG: hypothetical protein PUE19_05175 [bacterium]|nr:hypothetical protein [bacterium]